MTIIHNGDHADFEREHATTRPEDRPDWPLPSFDARDWAKAFMKANPRAIVGDVTEEDMIGWFANALMRGYDEHASRMAKSRGTTWIWYRGRPWQWHVFKPLYGTGYRAFWFGPFKIVVNN